ncbi:MAG TPA: hypothetical protein VFG84_00960 [Gemmatimonadaceae bacterium]|nr:hypothetical protein [Gemmatimonadaceae bacterium]
MSAAVVTGICDINALNAGARDFAASNQDALFTIIGDLRQLVKFGATAAGTDKSFDGLARLAAMRGTSAQKSGATGATLDALATGFLSCMESSVQGTVPPDFNVAGATGPGWMFEVRGKSGVDAESGAYERGASDSYWAAEAPSGWSASLDPLSPSKRFLVYGYRILDFLPNDPTVGSAFEIRTIPTIASGQIVLDSAFHIGLCSLDATATLRVQHKNDILLLKPLDCAPPPAFALAASFGEQLVNFFAPRPLYAFFIGAVGGAESELSPNAVIDMQAVTLSFVQPIADGQVSVAMADGNGAPVAVSVTTQSGTPLPNVVVTLAIAGNNSAIAFFQDGSAPASATVSRTTNALGVATFDNVFITKAGGYVLQVSGAFDGVAGAPQLSNPFNWQNK